MKCPNKAYNFFIKLYKAAFDKAFPWKPHTIRVAVFFFVFPISRSAHLWAPDEVKKKFFFAKQSRRPTHFHPAQQKKTMISISDRK